MRQAPPPDLAARRTRILRRAGWRQEALRTTLWFVPAALVAAISVVFVVSYAVDRAAYRGSLGLPAWIHTISADAARQVLVGIAASVITVIGVVFSLTILVLTLASQQFGPRMLRNFIRDRGTQFSLGAFVATFVYAVLTLGSIATGRHGEFVPQLSITVTEALLLGDVAVLIYFIHHIARSIQLPEVIAAIARDLSHAVETEFPLVPRPEPAAAGPEEGELRERLLSEGVTVPAPQSGYLQFVGFAELASVAEDSSCVIQLAHRPGHFVVAGSPLATVWPAAAADRVCAALGRTHITGPHRTLTQDPVFAIDQLVEIAIRALSPAVNDTFTALTCIDWLADGLCKLARRPLRDGHYRDHAGWIRLIEVGPSYPRMVNRAFDKIRQAGRGMPAVALRQLEALARVMEATPQREQRLVLLAQADMILGAAEEAIPEEYDRALVRARHRGVLEAQSMPA